VTIFQHLDEGVENPDWKSFVRVDLPELPVGGNDLHPLECRLAQIVLRNLKGAAKGGHRDLPLRVLEELMSMTQSQGYNLNSLSLSV